MKKQEATILIQNIKNDIAIRFFNDKQYNFVVFKNGFNITPCFDKEGSIISCNNNEKMKCYFTFKHLMNSLLTSLSDNFQKLWADNPSDKRMDALILFLYKEIERQCDQFNKRKMNNAFGKYKRYVIVSFIVWRFGFILSQKIDAKSLNGKNPTNQQLYEAIRYRLNKLNKV